MVKNFTASLIALVALCLAIPSAQAHGIGRIGNVSLAGRGFNNFAFSRGFYGAGLYGLNGNFAFNRFGGLYGNGLNGAFLNRGLYGNGLNFNNLNFNGSYGGLNGNLAGSCGANFSSLAGYGGYSASLIYQQPLIIQQPIIVTQLVPQIVYQQQTTLIDPGVASYGAGYAGASMGGYAAGGYAGALPVLAPATLSYLNGLNLAGRQNFLFRTYGAGIGGRLFNQHFGGIGGFRR